MDEDILKIKITAKGDAYGAQVLLNVLQAGIMYAQNSKNPTVDDFIDQIHKKIQNCITRARKNTDGTINMKELEDVHTISRLVDNMYGKYKKL